MSNVILFDLYGPEWLEDNKYTLWHLTPSNRVPNILEYGLKRPKTQEERQFQRPGEEIEGIFLLEDKEFVPDYLEQMKEIYPGYFSLLEVRLPLNTKAMPDETGISAVIIFDDIPPENIKQIDMLKEALQ